MMGIGVLGVMMGGTMGGIHRMMGGTAEGHPSVYDGRHPSGGTLVSKVRKLHVWCMVRSTGSDGLVKSLLQQFLLVFMLMFLRTAVLKKVK
jgi:hypothetical protein